MTTYPIYSLGNPSENDYKLLSGQEDLWARREKYYTPVSWGQPFCSYDIPFALRARVVNAYRRRVKHETFGRGPRTVNNPPRKPVPRARRRIARHVCSSYDSCRKNHIRFQAYNLTIVRKGHGKNRKPGTQLVTHRCVISRHLKLWKETWSTQHG